MRVRIFHSGLTNRIFASTRYTERGDGLFVSTKKDDVTQEAIAAVLAHARECNTSGCRCLPIRVHEMFRSSHE